MSMSAMATARSGSAGGGRTWIHPSEVAEMFPELLRTAPVSITAMRILNILPLLGLFAASPLHAQAATPAPGGKGKAIVEKLLRMTPEERRDFLKTHPEIRTVKSSTLRRRSLPAAASARCGRGEAANKPSSGRMLSILMAVIETGAVLKSSGNISATSEG